MYDYEKIADSTFGINAQALAVLAVLSNEVPNFAEYKDKYYQVSFCTYPWYNGRELGIMISMSPEFGGGNNVLNIAVYEHRNSDQICCLKWETKNFYFNHPLEDKALYDKAYKGGNKYDVDAEFAYLNIAGCTKWIMSEFEDFYKANHKYS